MALILRGASLTQLAFPAHSHAASSKWRRLAWTTLTEMGCPCSLGRWGWPSPWLVMLGSSPAPSSMLSMLRTWLCLSRSREGSTLLKGVKPCTGLEIQPFTGGHAAVNHLQWVGPVGLSLKHCFSR